MNCKRCGRQIPEGSAYCNWCGKYQLKKIADEITVPTPVQLPSGQWRIQLRREGESVVASTPDACRNKAIRIRKKWLQDEASGLHEPPSPVIPLSSVIDDYIKARTATRAITTIDGYKNIRRNRFKAYMDQDVNQIDYQQMIDEELDYSAKTIYNAWGLVRPALKMAKIEYDAPTLPRMTKKDRNWLDYKQIELFLDAIRDKPCELGALLALHSLRRSELFGLRPKDYDKANKIIHIRGAMHSTSSGWIRTDLNKNDTSRRDVPIIIPRLITLLDYIDQKNDYIIGDKQKNLYREINTVCAANNLPETGLHGLRHSFASLAYRLVWKKLSTMQVGGWRNSYVLDEIYTHNADLDSDVETMREYFVSKNDVTDVSDK